MVRLNGLIYDFSDLASVCVHLQERHSLSATSAPTFSQVAYVCSECAFVSSIPVDFADHFSVRPVDQTCLAFKGQILPSDFFGPSDCNSSITKIVLDSGRNEITR